MRPTWHFRLKSERRFRAMPLQEGAVWLHLRRWLHGHLGLQKANRKGRGLQELRGYHERDPQQEVVDTYEVKPGDRFVLTRLPIYRGSRARDDVARVEGVTEEERISSIKRQMHREWVAPRRRAEAPPTYDPNLGIPKALCSLGTVSMDLPSN